MFWIPHIDGVPFRKLGNEHELSGKQAYTRVIAEFQKLPHNLHITKTLCHYQSGILVIDGKYIKVRGYTKKIPFIYLIDYVTHDILFSVLSHAEDERTFLDIFQTLKKINYPLQIVVADDRTSLPLALKQVFPEVPVQLCLNHYIENIRGALHVRTDPTHHYFFHILKKLVFEKYTNDTALDNTLNDLRSNHCQNNPLRLAIINDIDRRRLFLFAHKNIFDCPNNTNLIELFNSHFNARLKSIKGFKTKAHAELWLNALLLRRRTQPFTDCGPKFKYLNGKCSLEMSMKKQALWPEILGVKAPER